MVAPASLRGLVGYFLRLGTTGFGGPIALVGYMQRDLVDTRGWVEKEEYAEGLALAQLAPGPLAAQLAMYLGWLRGRVLGATLVGAAFVAPSFLMVLALSALYVRFGGLSWLQDLFYGIGAAVIAIIARSAWKLVRMTAKRDWLLWSLAVANATLTAWSEREVVWAFVLSGVLVLVFRGMRGLAASTKALALAGWPMWTTGAGPGGPALGLLGTILWYFTKAGSVVFGSGLAVVPFLYGGVVREYHWLTERQFLDAVAVAMVTPGPVVITVAFIGYLVAGPLGATAAAVGVFVPVYLVVVLVAPHFRRLVGNPGIKAFVDGVTTAAAGAIAGAVVVLGRRSLVDPVTIGIGTLTLLLILRLKKAPEPVLILGAGAVGVLLRRTLAG